MKKRYMKPLATEVAVETGNMIAASLPISNDDRVSSDEQLSNDKRGSWGDLWKMQ